MTRCFNVITESNAGPGFVLGNITMTHEGVDDCEGSFTFDNNTGEVCYTPTPAELDPCLELHCRIRITSDNGCGCFKIVTVTFRPCVLNCLDDVPVCSNCSFQPANCIPVLVENGAMLPVRSCLDTTISDNPFAPNISTNGQYTFSLTRGDSAQFSTVVNYTDSSDLLNQTQAWLEASVGGDWSDISTSPGGPGFFLLDFHTFGANATTDGAAAATVLKSFTAVANSNGGATATFTTFPSSATGCFGTCTGNLCAGYAAFNDFLLNTYIGSSFPMTASPVPCEWRHEDDFVLSDGVTVHLSIVHTFGPTGISAIVTMTLSNGVIVTANYSSPCGNPQECDEQYTLTLSSSNDEGILDFTGSSLGWEGGVAAFGDCN